jgi:4-nitrophenyl phosphatase
VITDGSEAESADFVFVGWDRDFDYGKLKAAVIAIRNGAEYLATNSDTTYPTPEGLWPGAGSILAAVSAGSGKEPVIVGKPSPFLVELALERVGVGPGEALLIGDRLDTDIDAGNRAGVDTALVLTGVSRAEETETLGIRPRYVFENLKGLLKD